MANKIDKIVDGGNFDRAKLLNESDHSISSSHRVLPDVDPQSSIHIRKLTLKDRVKASKWKIIGGIAVFLLIIILSVSLSKKKPAPNPGPTPPPPFIDNPYVVESGS